MGTSKPKVRNYPETIKWLEYMSLMLERRLIEKYIKTIKGSDWTFKAIVDYDEDDNGI